MPIRTDTLYKSYRLHYWFAASSVLMTTSIVWLIWTDYDRPWRHFQDDHAANKASLAYLEFVQTTRHGFEERLARARSHAENVRRRRDELRGEERRIITAELADAEMQTTKAQSRWSRASQLLEIVHDDYERLRNVHGPDDVTTIATKLRYTIKEAEVDGFRIDKERREEKVAQLTRRLQDIDAPVIAAEKQLQELTNRRGDAESRFRQYQGMLRNDGLLARLPIVRWVINFPMLDFVAPKNTPARHQINQLVLPAVRQDLHYLDTYTTNRCTTCHVAINDADLTSKSLARVLEDALPAISEARSRTGDATIRMPQPPRIDRKGDAELAAGRGTEHWDWLTSAQRQQYLSGLLDVVNEFLVESGVKPLRLRQPLLAHPDLEMYVAQDSPHPMSTMGCTVCHEGNGHETDFVLAAHTPSDETEAERWSEQYNARRLGMVAHTRDEVNDHWDRPMVPLRHIESACARCHTKVWDLPRFGKRGIGGELIKGKYLFGSLGCVNCHPVDGMETARRVGPDLRRIATKLSPEFVTRWILDPQSFRPTTRMPHFFRQENNRPESADELDIKPERRTFTEAHAIMKYLFAVSDRAKLKQPPLGVTGNPSWGRELVKSLGCLACHANLSEYGEYWITNDLFLHGGLDRKHATEAYESMTYQQRGRYAMRRFRSELETLSFSSKEKSEDQPRVDRPILTRFAPDLSGIGSKVRFGWLYSWLLSPPSLWPDTKMPNLGLSPTDAVHIATYLANLEHLDYEQNEGAAMDTRTGEMAADLLFTLLEAQQSTQRARAIVEDRGGLLVAALVSRLEPSMGTERAQAVFSAMSLEDRRMALLGAKMISHYGCYACHSIRGFEETSPPGTDLSLWAEKPIARLDFGFFGRGHEPVREANGETFRFVYPQDAHALIERSYERNPELRVRRSHASFARYKLLNPRLWDRLRTKKPYDKLKMPNFYLSDDEAGALITFLLSRKSPGVRATLRADAGLAPVGSIADGRAIALERNCVGCHEIDGNEPVIHQYLAYAQGEGESFDRLNAPPSLRGVGAKVQTSWLYGFLEEAEPIRDWLAVRMPSFRLAREERVALARMFVGLCVEEASWLHDRLATETGHLASTHAIQGELRQFANEYHLLHSVAAMGSVRRDARIALDDDEVQRQLEHLRNLYDLSYPTMDVPSSVLTEQRLEDGQTLFSSLNCMACHVFTDPRNTENLGRSLAPNLQPIYRRLRREWVHRYLEKPRRMLPYTYMPDLFGQDATSPFFAWAPTERAQLQALLHDREIMKSGRAVIGVLTDFLYDAGAKYRSDIISGSPISRQSYGDRTP